MPVLPASVPSPDAMSAVRFTTKPTRSVPQLGTHDQHSNSFLHENDRDVARLAPICIGMLGGMDAPWPSCCDDSER